MLRLNQVKKFNFLYLQQALIAHSNAEVVDAFEHYDKLNKQRVNNIKNTIIQQKKNLDECKENTDRLKKMVLDKQETLTEFTEMYEQYKHERALMNVESQLSQAQTNQPVENESKKKKPSKKTGNKSKAK